MPEKRQSVQGIDAWDAKNIRKYIAKTAATPENAATL
jgi:hypothetical protein